MDGKLKVQLEKIRSSGKTNMFDISKVQWIAFQKKYYKLVNWISEHQEQYVRFILTGEEENK